MTLSLFMDKGQCTGTQGIGALCEVEGNSQPGTVGCVSLHGLMDIGMFLHVVRDKTQRPGTQGTGALHEVKGNSQPGRPVRDKTQRPGSRVLSEVEGNSQTLCPGEEEKDSQPGKLF